MRSRGIPICVYLPMEDPVARRSLDSDEVRQVRDPADRWSRIRPPMHKGSKYGQAP